MFLEMTNGWKRLIGVAFSRPGTRAAAVEEILEASGIAAAPLVMGRAPPVQESFELPGDDGGADPTCPD
jgi:hypothetical protein